MSEHAYAPTPVGAIEIKTLPSAVAFVSHADDPKGDARRELFSKNFQFLKANDLKMTTPVEMDLERRHMRFFVPAEDRGKDLKPAPDVDVADVPERRVVSVGMRGSYAKERAAEGERRLRGWLDGHPEYRATGPASTVYWNGPMVPGFLRRMEVHVPVERVDDASDLSRPGSR